MIMKHYLIYISSLFIFLFSTITLAEKTITISVKTNESSAAGIGYSVGGKKNGGAGKSYVGKGPANKTYVFGYRKNSINGRNIRCGTLKLNKNSSVVLRAKGNKCTASIQ